MDYSEIINSSFRLAWRHKSLWVLGLFASGYGLYSFQSSFDLTSEDRWINLSGLGLSGISISGWLFAAVVVIILLLGFTAIFLTALCKPAVIDAINRLTRGGVYTLGTSFATGFRFFWRVLGVFVLHFVVYVGFMLVMVPIGVGAYFAHPALLIAFLLVGFPVLILFMFAVESVFQLTYRAMVVRDAPISAAFSEGIALLRRFPGPCAIMFILYFVLYVITTLIAAGVLIGLAIPFVVLAMTSGVGLIVALAVGIPLFWVVSLPVGGFFGAAFETMYTLFYFRLLEPAPAAAAQPTVIG